MVCRRDVGWFRPELPPTTSEPNRGIGSANVKRAYADKDTPAQVSGNCLIFILPTAVVAVDMQLLWVFILLKMGVQHRHYTVGVVKLCVVLSDSLTFVVEVMNLAAAGLINNSKVVYSK